MKAGILNTKIVLESPELNTNSYGEQHKEWKQIAEVRCNVNYESGDRIILNSEIVFTSNMNFTIRNYTKVNESMRILYEDRYYRIISIQNDKKTKSLIIKTELQNE